MEYISCAEAAAKWGISERRVQKLCEGEYILRGSSGKMGHFRKAGTETLRGRAHTRRGKVQSGLADTQRRGKAR